MIGNNKKENWSIDIDKIKYFWHLQRYHYCVIIILSKDFYSDGKPGAIYWIGWLNILLPIKYIVTVANADTGNEKLQQSDKFIYINWYFMDPIIRHYHIDAISTLIQSLIDCQKIGRCWCRCQEWYLTTVLDWLKTNECVLRRITSYR